MTSPHTDFKTELLALLDDPEVQQKIRAAAATANAEFVVDNAAQDSSFRATGEQGDDLGGWNDAGGWR